MRELFTLRILCCRVFLVGAFRPSSHFCIKTSSARQENKKWGPSIQVPLAPSIGFCSKAFCGSSFLFISQKELGHHGMHSDIQNILYNNKCDNFFFLFLMHGL
jgi:hypothetical protein